MKYQVEFIDNETEKLVYSTKLSGGTWAKSSIKYFKDWKIIDPSIVKATEKDFERERSFDNKPVSNMQKSLKSILKKKSAS